MIETGNHFSIATTPGPSPTTSGAGSRRRSQCRSTAPGRRRPARWPGRRQRPASRPRPGRSSDGEDPADRSRDREDEPLCGVRQVIALAEVGGDDWFGHPVLLGGRRRHQVDVHRHQRSVELRRQAFEIEPLGLAEGPIGRVGQLTELALLRRTEPSGHLDLDGRDRRDLVDQGHESSVDEEQTSVVEPDRHDRVDTGATVLRAVDDQHALVGEVAARGGDRPPRDVVGIGAGRQQLVDRHGFGVVPLLDERVELAWRSSSRRSCQKPRLIMATIAATTRRWKAIHLGRSRNRYMPGERYRPIRGTAMFVVHRPARAALAGWTDGVARLPHPARREDRVDDRDERMGARAGVRRGPTPCRRPRPTRTRSACPT